MTTNKENELKDLLADEKEEYRKKIIEMVKNVNRKDILIYIFKIVEDIIKEDYNKQQAFILNKQPLQKQRMSL